MRDHLLPVFPHSKVRILLSAVALVALIGTSVATGVFRVQPSRAQSPGSWSTYLFDNTHSGFNASETIINPTSARNLKLQWTATTSGCPGSPGSPTDISTQPIVSQDLQLIFWGAWDGCEYATNFSGQPVWSTFLGQTNNPRCAFPSTLGVASTATLTTETIGGTSTSVLLVGAEMPTSTP